MQRQINTGYRGRAAARAPCGKLRPGGLQKVIYIASASGDDEEMRRRMSSPAASPKHFITVEERFYPHLVLEREGRADTFILLDCLTLLLSNHLIKEACREGGEKVPHCLYPQSRRMLGTGKGCGG